MNRRLRWVILAVLASAACVSLFLLTRKHEDAYPWKEYPRSLVDRLLRLDMGPRVPGKASWRDVDVVVRLGALALTTADSFCIVLDASDTVLKRHGWDTYLFKAGPGNEPERVPWLSVRNPEEMLGAARAGPWFCVAHPREPAVGASSWTYLVCRGGDVYGREERIEPAAAARYDETIGEYVPAGDGWILVRLE